MKLIIDSEVWNQSEHLDYLGLSDFMRYTKNIKK